MVSCNANHEQNNKSVHPKISGGKMTFICHICHYLFYRKRFYIRFYRRMNCAYLFAVPDKPV